MRKPTHGTPRATRWRRDVGYFLVSRNYADVGKFITPTLRELRYTGPYMHNGLFESLDDVIAFYNQGGGQDDPLGLLDGDLQLLRELRSLGLAAEPLRARSACRTGAG